MGRNAGGRSGTLAPAASLVLLRGRERMGRTDWEEACVALPGPSLEPVCCGGDGVSVFSPKQVFNPGQTFAVAGDAHP